jgi:hypothetical protein
MLEQHLAPGQSLYPALIEQRESRIGADCLFESMICVIQLTLI